MKFTKRSAASVALGAALLVCVGYANVIGTDGTTAQEIDGSSGATVSVSPRKDDPEELERVRDEYAGRDAFEIVEIPMLSSIHDVLISPRGEWALATGFGERTHYPDLEDLEHLSEREPRCVLLDRDMNIVLEFSESSHDFRPLRYMAWAPDESAFVFIASPPEPPRLPSGAGLVFESEHEPETEGYYKDLEEWAERRRELSARASRRNQKRREAARTRWLSRVDMDTYEVSRIAEIEPGRRVWGLGTGPEGDFHLAMSGRRRPDNEPRYEVHRIGHEGETKTTYELPLLPERANLRDNPQFNAATTSFWFALHSGWPERWRLPTGSRPPRRWRSPDAPVWLASIAYGPGNEEAEWEFWSHSKNLLLNDVSPCGKAVLFRVKPEDAESFMYRVLDVKTGHVTPVVSDDVTLPNTAVAVREGGAVVRFLSGFMPPRFLIDYRLP